MISPPANEASFFAMGVPYGTTGAWKTLPYGALLLFLLNAGFLALGYTLPESRSDSFALNPAALEAYQFLTLGFLHFGVAHFVWTAVFLWIFTPALEQRIGQPMTLAIYLLSAAMGGVGYLLLGRANPMTAPFAGATPAVAGLLGAFCLLLPQERIRCWIPPPFRSLLNPQGTVHVRVSSAVMVFILLNVVFALWKSYPEFNLMVCGAGAVGFLTGVGAAAAWKQIISKTEPEEMSRVSADLRERLEIEIRKKEAEQSRKIAEPQPVSALNLQPESALIPLILERVDFGDAEGAYDLYFDFAKASMERCLDVEDQWQLARLLIETGHNEGAIQVLKRLLRRFSQEAVAIRARYELGRLYAKDEAQRDQAIANLRRALTYEALQPGPADAEEDYMLDEESKKEARELLRDLGAEEDGDEDDTRVFGLDDEVDLALFESDAEGDPSNLADVFGSVDGTDAHAPLNLESSGALGQISKQGYSKPHLSDDDLGPLVLEDHDAEDRDPVGRGRFASAPVSDRKEESTNGASQRAEESGLEVPIDDSSGEIPTSEPKGGLTSQSPALIAPIPDDDTERVFEEDAIELPADDSEGSDRARGSRAGPNDPTRIQRSRPIEPIQTQDVEPVRLDDLSGGLFPAAAARIPAEISQQDTAEARGLLYSEEHRYSVVLEPSAEIHLEGIVAVLQKRLPMSAESVVHALKRHHGILADDLGRDEALELGAQFNEHGQHVIVIEHDERLNFGEPKDIYQVSVEEEWGRFADATHSWRRSWSDLIAMGGGAVRVDPAAPQREVIDLFFRNPGLHLRLWRTTLSSAGSLRRAQPLGEDQFRSLGASLAQSAPHAIQSRSFGRWSRKKKPRALAEFTSLIEYENYNMWYLMANHGRSKLMRADVSTG